PRKDLQYNESDLEAKPEGKILIVDDEAYLVDLMKEILQNEGEFDIDTTTEGPEALEMVNDTYDLIISDIRMPEVNGMDIYDYIQLEKMDIKILMVTADSFSEDVAAFLREHKIDYLKKPFELMEFKKRVLAKLT
ncbi:MAG: response regulator, partial [bacterium]|nr:response regulator [bacterium]